MTVRFRAVHPVATDPEIKHHALGHQRSGQSERVRPVAAWRSTYRDGERLKGRWTEDGGRTTVD